jgi:hypothetical protein
MQAQEELLSELKEFYRESLSGTKSIDDLVDMGLEYVPGTRPDPRTWLPSQIGCLAARVAASKQAGSRA